MGKIKAGTSNNESYPIPSQEEREMKVDVFVYLLVCLFVCAQLEFSAFMQFRTHFLGTGATHMGLNLPTSTNLKQFLTDKSTSQLNVGIN